MTKSKIFLYLMLAFVGGVGSGSFFDMSQEIALIVIIICLIIIVVFYPIRGRGTLRALAASNGAGRRGSKILSFPIALGAFLVLAFAAGVLRFDASESLTKILTNFSDTNVNIELVGHISDEPQRLNNRQRLTLQVKEIRASGYRVFTDEKVLITTGLYPEFEYGDLVLAEGKLESPKNFYPVESAEGGAQNEQFNRVNDFDYVNYLAKDGIFSLSYYPKIEKTGQFKVSIFRQIFKFKNIFEDSISRSIAEPNASFVKGILLGSREDIPRELKDAFNKTGTTHILAISGYNITIIGLYVSYFLLFFMKRQTAFWLTVSAIVLFTILTGASPSVTRAALMGILVLLAYREGRFYNMTNAIVFAGTAMVALNPKVLRFDIGFQLSFLATLGLIYLAPPLKRKLEKLPEVWTLKENFIATVSAQAAVLPVILYNFGNFSLVSLPANVLILPVIPLTMLFGFLSGITGLVWLKLGEILGYPAWLISEYVISIVRLLS